MLINYSRNSRISFNEDIGVFAHSIWDYFEVQCFPFMFDPSDSGFNLALDLCLSYNLINLFCIVFYMDFLQIDNGKGLRVSEMRGLNYHEDLIPVSGLKTAVFQMSHELEGLRPVLNLGEDMLSDRGGVLEHVFMPHHFDFEIFGYFPNTFHALLNVEFKKRSFLDGI